MHNDEEPESTETEQGQYLLTAEDAELLQEILNHKNWGAVVPKF
jgi:hypothetical protein